MPRSFGGSVDFLDRFWRKIDQCGPNDCWRWTAIRNEQDYGVANGSGGLAHRVAWMLTHSLPLTRDQCILHTCDIPACCNPGHLRRGTQVENVEDMHRKGRGYRQNESHCPHGHEWTPENTSYNIKKKYTQCRECHRIGNRVTGPTLTTAP